LKNNEKCWHGVMSTTREGSSIASVSSWGIAFVIIDTDRLMRSGCGLFSIRSFGVLSLSYLLTGEPAMKRLTKL
jgi:hypothetical protein